MRVPTIYNMLFAFHRAFRMSDEWHPLQHIPDCSRKASHRNTVMFLKVGGGCWVDILPGLTPQHFYMKQILPHLQTYHPSRSSSERSRALCSGWSSGSTGTRKEWLQRNPWLGPKAVPSQSCSGWWSSGHGCGRDLLTLLCGGPSLRLCSAKVCFEAADSRGHFSGTTSPFQTGCYCLRDLL